MVRSCDEKRRLKLHEKNYVNGRRSRGRQKKQWGDTTRHEMSPIEARIRIQPEQHAILTYMKSGLSSRKTQRDGQRLRRRRGLLKIWTICLTWYMNAFNLIKIKEDKECFVVPLYGTS